MQKVIKKAQKEVEIAHLVLPNNITITTTSTITSSTSITNTASTTPSTYSYATSSNLFLPTTNTLLLLPLLQPIPVLVLPTEKELKQIATNSFKIEHLTK